MGETEERIRKGGKYLERDRGEGRYRGRGKENGRDERKRK